MGIDSLVRKIGRCALAGLTALVASCMPLKKSSIEPRLGLVVPIAEEQKEYDASFTVGAAYGVSGAANGPPKDRIGLEVCLDYFHSSAQYIETNSLLLEVNATYPVKDIAPAIYLTGGLVLLSEFSNIDIPPPFDVHDEKSDTTFGLGFGADFRFDAKDIEDVGARVGYIVLFGENVKGMFVLTGGYRF